MHERVNLILICYTVKNTSHNMLTCCTALNVTKGLPETWWSRVRTEETTVTVRLLTRLPTAIQIFYHQLKIISTWHINTHTHTHTPRICMEVCMLGKYHRFARPTSPTHTVGQETNPTDVGNNGCHGYPIYSRTLYIQLEMFRSLTTRPVKPSTPILIMIIMRQYLDQRIWTSSVPWNLLTD